jgi:hypothetical protein
MVGTIREGDAPMTVRNIFSRVEKLEARRQRPDELLLIWRLPGAPVSKAVADARFATGDRVICAEWFGDDPLPAPRWYRERLSSELGAVENEYLSRSLDRVVEGACLRDPGYAETPMVSAHRVRELTDNDLLHMVFGVAT